MLTDALNSVKTRSPLQVFAVFAVGIILPSGFLSYLGLRSFQYEGALMRKQTEEQYTAVANLMQKELNEKLTGWVDALREFSRQSAFEHQSTPEMIPLVLSTKKLDTLPVDALFVFDEDNRMIVPWLAESGANTDNDTPAALDWGRWSDEINRLERLEFVDKKVAEAVQGYAALMSRHLPWPLQAELLKSIADGQRKLREYRLSEANYLKLAGEYDQTRDVSGLPMGILARQLLIRLYREEKALDKAMDVRLDLIEGLLLRHWKLTGTRQAQLLQEFEEAVQSGISAGGPERKDRWENLQTLQGRLERLTSAGRAFVDRSWPDLLKRLRQRGWMEQGGALELAGSNPSRKIAILSPTRSPESDRRRGMIVALVPGEAVWPALEKTFSDPANPDGLQISWDRPSARLGSLAAAQHAPWKVNLKRDVDQLDPPIHFGISPVSSQEQNRLSQRRLWIYGGMVGLSFLVILVGLILMRRAVKREIEVANLKADFVANVSHELRTPLTTISYIGERLNLGRYRTDEERKEFYGMLDKETHRLRGLIEDILDFSKMLAGKKFYRDEPIELIPLLQEAYDRFRGKAQAKGFEVLLDLPPEDLIIRGDRTALMQAMLNLMDNALKYSGQSRKIDVQLRTDPAHAYITVRDYGIGIAESEKEKIFEKFYRVEQGLARDTAGGVGLGLAMVKHIVEGHHGHIRVESRLGEGSVFSLEFPLLQQGGVHGAYISR